MAWLPPEPCAARSALAQQRSRRRSIALLWLPTAVAAAGAALAQPPAPAAVGRERPLTTSWLCENERSVLLNVHPRRAGEEGWLTYAGNRTPVQRIRDASQVTYASADGKLSYVVRGDEATLSVDGVLQQPIQCWRKQPVPR